MPRHKITVWDDEPERIAATESALVEALKLLNVEADIARQCEPPLLARMGLTGITPVIEIGGEYWRLKPGHAPDARSCHNLLSSLGLATSRKK